MDFSSGGKKVIERLVEAYGFSTRQALLRSLGSIQEHYGYTLHARHLPCRLGFCNVLSKLVIH